MQKICPRCGVGLSFNAESVQTPWIFARCYQCHQTNLIRYADQIPVDQSSAQHQTLSTPDVFLSETLREKNSKPLPAYMPKTRKPRFPIRGAITLAVLSVIGIGGGILAANSQAKIQLIQLTDNIPNLLNHAPKLLASLTPTSFATPPQRAPASVQVPAVTAVTLPVAPPIQREQIEVIATQALLRSGPGTGFKKLGFAAAHLKLLVMSQQDNWIQVELPKQNTAWIRQDLVKKAGS